MKSPQKVTKLQLNYNLEDEYILLGIVSSDPDYKLSLSINNKLNISLQSDKPVDVSGKNKNSVTFSKFSDYKMAPERTYQLISNRHEKEYFLKKFHKLDYLLHIYSSDSSYDTEGITAKLREIDSITAVFILEQENINVIRVPTIPSKK